MSPHIKSTKVLTLLSIFAASALALCGLSSNAMAKANLDVLFEHSGFTDKNLYRCMLDAYKDANGMISDYEVLAETSYAGWSMDGGKTFRPEKAANVKDTGFCNYVADVSLTGLEQFTNLETIKIAPYGMNATDASMFANFPNLKNLSFRFTYRENEYADISALANLTNLEQLIIGGHISDYSPLGSLTNLKKLSIGYGQSSLDLTDVSFLSSLVNLETLDLRNGAITDLSPLANLTNLKYLAVEGNDSLTDLSPLDNLENLEYIDIRDVREYDFAQEGDESVHPSFNDGVLYKAVVDSYYREQGDYSLGDVPFFEIEYDKAAHRKEILTNEQLASIETLMNLDGTPWASRTPKINDTTGLALMPNLKSIIFDMMMTKDENIDLSGNPKLEKFIVYAYTGETVDFSHNPELRYVDFWQSFWLTSLDFSHNPKLQYLTVFSDQLTSLDISSCHALTQLNLMGAKVEKLALPDAPHFHEFKLTGSGVESASIYLIPSENVKLREFGGRGGSDDETLVEDEQLVFDISSLDFIQNSNTNVDGTLENETITVKDPACYSYDASAKVVLVKSSCVAAGLKSATLIHSYTINGTDYTNEFDIDFNLDEDDNEEESEPAPATPNTGLFTGTDDRASSSTLILAILAGLSVSVFTFFTLKKYQKV